MINVQDIVSTLESRLDAQGTDYYNFENNYKTAINESVKFIVSLIDRAIEENKITSEVLYTLQESSVIQLSKYSRFTYDDNAVWSIRSINPLPKTEAIEGVTEVTHENKLLSVTRNDLVHVYSHYWCKRLTKEEWELNAQNPFSPGNIVINCSNLEHGSMDNVSFAYLSPYSYGMKVTVGEETIPVKEIEIRPYIPEKRVTLFYVKRPEEVTQVTDTINLHSKLFGFLIEKCLNYIAYEQGDNTNIFQLSQRELQLITSILS